MYLKRVEAYISQLRQKKKENVEVEVKVLLDNRIRCPSNVSIPEQSVCNEYIKGLLGSTSVEASSESTINFISTKSDYMFVKQLHFVNGVQDKSRKNYYTKKSLMKPIYMTSNTVPPYKLCVNMETVEEKDINEYDIIRFRVRRSTVIDDNWRLDITFVKEYKGSDINIIKHIRDKLFNADFSELLGHLRSYLDRVEVEVEYVGDISEFAMGKISRLDDLFVRDKNSSEIMIDKLCLIAETIGKTNIHKYKQGTYGLKQIGSNPIEIGKTQYFTDILPNIDNFFITEKVDGTRAMLVIQSESYYIIKNDIKTIELENTLKNTRGDTCENTDGCIILDTEEVGDKYYVFDVLHYGEINVSRLPFSERITYIDRVVSEIGDPLRNKHFVELTKSSYGEQIEMLHKDMHSYDYECDGMIFISKNEDYCNTLNFKRKPVETIDFIARKCPKNMLGITPYTQKPQKTLYLLFCGIRTEEYQKMRINRLLSYDSLFKNICVNKYGKTNLSYIPVQFSPSSDPHAYLYWSDVPDLDGKIVELTRRNHSWKLIKTRDDRVQNDVYYGNNMRVAEQIWMNYKSPLTIQTMKMSRNSAYFARTSTDYVAMRKFVNYVKESILPDRLNDVIDLACGKGQDLLKYIQRGANNLWMIDNDDDALSELMSRKYTYNKLDVSYALYINKMDLTDDYKVNLKTLLQHKYRFPHGGVPLVVCNLALHYLLDSKQSITNFANLLSKIIAPKGTFIFTAFDGDALAEMFKDKKELRWGDMYHIRKVSAKTKKSSKIDVLLPFSGGKYYTENIINMRALQAALRKKKIRLVDSGSFAQHLDGFKADKPHFYDKMSKDDIEYSSLYHFYICQVL